MLQDIGKKIDQNTPDVDLKSNPKDLAKKAADKASNAVSDLSAVFDLAESPTNIGDNIRVRAGGVCAPACSIVALSSMLAHLQKESLCFCALYAAGSQCSLYLTQNIRAQGLPSRMQQL